MKYLNLILLLFCLLLFAGKIQAQKPAKQELQIHFGQEFRNDRVKVYFDEKLVLDKKITVTDTSMTRTFFNVPKPKKPFAITVEVNGVKFEKSALKKARELDREDYAIVINYNRQTEEVEIQTKTVTILNESDLTF